MKPLFSRYSRADSLRATLAALLVSVLFSLVGVVAGAWSGVWVGVVFATPFALCIPYRSHLLISEDAIWVQRTYCGRQFWLRPVAVLSKGIPVEGVVDSAPQDRRMKWRAYLVADSQRVFLGMYGLKSRARLTASSVANAVRAHVK